MAGPVTWSFGRYSGPFSDTWGFNPVPDYEDKTQNDVEKSFFTNPLNPGAVTIPSAQKLFAPFVDSVVDENQKPIFVDGSIVNINGKVYDALSDHIIDIQPGEVSLRYDVVWRNKIYDGVAQTEGFSSSTSFIVLPNYPPLPRWNAKTVINRLLVKAETLRKSQTPRFHLNAEQAEEFEKIEMPELHLTNSTLREALQTVGSYIHGEPRLNGTEISYDMYGGSERTAVDFSKYFSKSFQQSIDSALTSIDSTVDNLVSTIGYAKGVMVEPYSGGYKTVRTETLYARIQDDNMIIATTYPVNRIIKLESGSVGGKYGGTDLTPYVFEASEYTRLSSYSSLYPTSRAYAIYYTQGEKNIKGLNFKQTDAISPAFKNYAILNILRAATGDNSLEASYTTLAFRITYESVSSARVKQSKQYIEDFNRVSEIAYNQGQNLIESSYYGEHLKGVVARLGNVDKVITLYQRGTPDIPKTGTLYDDEYYISAVAVEYQPYFTKISCALSKDFNRYSDYVGINSTKRFYEISERQAYDSFINYRDYVIIGAAVATDSTEPKALLPNLNGIKNAFKKDVPRSGVTCVVARGQAKDTDGNISDLNEVILPVQAFAMGNAVVFTFKYQDNYSAGDNATFQQGGTGGNSVSGFYQNSVPYKDYYGNMEYLTLKYYRSATTPAVDVDSESPDHWQNDIGITLPDTTLPAGDGSKIGGADLLLTTGEDPLWLQIGSTEVPTITYQIELVTNRRGLIIGSALAGNVKLIGQGADGHEKNLYVLPYRINKFAMKLNPDNLNALQNCGEVEFYGDTQSGAGWDTKDYLKHKIYTGSETGQSWAIIDAVTGEVLLAENREIRTNESVFGENLWFTLVHDVIKR